MNNLYKFEKKLILVLTKFTQGKKGWGDGQKYEGRLDPAERLG